MPGLRTVWTTAGLAMAVVAAALVQPSPSAIDGASARAQLSGGDLQAMAPPMPICGSARRVTCVVDGDTFWIDGEKVRLASIDAPEVRGDCQYERDLARRATERLSGILSTGGFQLSRTGVDRYGRTLAHVETGQGEAGAILVREGLARPWAGRKAQWCS